MIAFLFRASGRGIQPALRDPPPLTKTFAFSSTILRGTLRDPLDPSDQGAHGCNAEQGHGRLIARAGGTNFHCAPQSKAVTPNSLRTLKHGTMTQGKLAKRVFFKNKKTLLRV